MKILMVSFTFPPNKDGVSEAASAVVAAYRGMGWHVDVLTLPSTETRVSADWNGANVIEYKRSKPGELFIEGVTHQTLDYLQSGGWDLIIFQTYDHLFKDILPRLDELPTRKVLISHGYPGLVRYPMKRFPWGYPSMFRRFLRGFSMIRWLPKIDRVVYLSEYADLKGFYDHWLAKFTKYPGCRIIPNGIDPKERGSDPDGFRKRHGIPNDAFLFLCVANYSPRKDQGYAARAFRHAAIPNSRFIFIGSEINDHAKKFIDEDRANAKAGEQNHVLWLEKIDRSTTLDAFEACDAFVLSALHEAQPISLLESMRAEKPWIARRSGCIHLMEGGLCVGSIAAMVRAMRSIVGDQALRVKLARIGRTAVEKNYSRSTYMQRYINLAEDLVSYPVSAGTRSSACCE